MRENKAKLSRFRKLCIQRIIKALIRPWPIGKVILFCFTDRKGGSARKLPTLGQAD